MEDDADFLLELPLEVGEDYDGHEGGPLLVYGVLKAVVEENLEKVAWFAKQGKDVNVSDGAGNTPLHVAIIKNNQDILDFLLSHPGIDLDSRNFSGETPLFTSLKNGRVSMSQSLILMGANVNIPNCEDVTPLHISVKHASLARLIVDHGAYLDAVDYTGDTALHDAVAEECLGTVSMLLCYGADANVCGVNNLTPFMKAIISRNVEIQAELVDYVTDFNAETLDHVSTLALALMHKSPFVEEIVAGGADVNFAYGYDLVDSFSLCLQYPNVKNFRLIWDKLKYDGDDMSLGSVLWRISGTLRKEVFKLYVDVIIDSDNLSQVVESITNADDFYMVIVRFCDFFHQLSLDQLTKLTCRLLTFGYDPTSFDMSKVFLHYGYCGLFRILLHMDVRYIGRRPPDMSRIIYDVRTDIESLLDQLVAAIDVAYLWNTLYQLLDYCVYPKLVRAYLELNRDDAVSSKMLRLPTVPSLLQVARDRTREYLVRKFQADCPRKFYTLVNYLDVSPSYKEILTFERVLYRFESSEEEC